MPNWCTNALKVTGRADQVLELAARAVGLDAGALATVAEAIVAETTGSAPMTEAARHELRLGVLANEVRRHGGELSFEHHVPQPELEEPEDQARAAFPAWYEWRLRHWGCKWNAAEGRLEELELHDGERATVCWSFDTPWSPPEAWLATVWEQHPEVRLEMFCEEEGMGYLCHFELDPELGPSCAEFSCHSREQLEEYFVERKGLDAVPEWYDELLEDEAACEAELAALEAAADELARVAEEAARQAAADVTGS
jgi:hypothetical protein